MRSISEASMREGVTREEVIKTVNEILIGQLGIEPEEIQPDGDLQDDHGADSLDAVEIAMAVEEDFEILIDDDDLNGLTTPNAWIEYVVKALNVTH
jgi:acyl carrier protein